MVGAGDTTGRDGASFQGEFLMRTVVRNGEIVFIFPAQKDFFSIKVNVHLVSYSQFRTRCNDVILECHDLYLSIF